MYSIKIKKGPKDGIPIAGHPRVSWPDGVKEDIASSICQACWRRTIYSVNGRCRAQGVDLSGHGFTRRMGPPKKKRMGSSA